MEALRQVEQKEAVVHTSQVRVLELGKVLLGQVWLQPPLTRNTAGTMVKQDRQFVVVPEQVLQGVVQPVHTLSSMI